MLNLYHLKYFGDACRLGSIVSSAKLNRVSHSAVSQAIRAMEREMGVALLSHSKRRFELTPEGSALFAETESVFNELERALASVSSTGGKLRGPLRMGFSHSVGLSFLSRDIARFSHDHPDVEPTIRIGNSKALETLLESREIELGFGLDDDSFAKFDRVPIFSGRFVLVSSADVKPAARYLVGDKGQEVVSLRTHLKRTEPAAKFMTVQSWELILSLVRSGAGIGLVPDFLVQHPKDKDGGRFKVSSKIALPSYRLCAFARSIKSLSPSARAFVDLY